MCVFDYVSDHKLWPKSNRSKSLNHVAPELKWSAWQGLRRVPLEQPGEERTLRAREIHEHRIDGTLLVLSAQQQSKLRARVLQCPSTPALRESVPGASRGRSTCGTDRS